MTGEHPLLVLDYPGRRPEAPVSALRLDDAGHAALSLLAPPLPVETTGRAYAERLVAAYTGPPPGAVIAYCAASPIAIHVAHLVHEQRGWTPALVFFDPTPTSAADIDHAYAAAVAQVPGGGPATGELPALPEDPVLLLKTVHDDLTRRAATALLAQGLSEDVIAEPVEHFAGQHVDYLAYLVAARGPVPRAAAGPMLQVLSVHHRDHRDWLPDGDLDTVRVEADRPGLLADETTRTAVLSFLATTKRRQYP